jgi:hypothetical protein
MLLFLSLFIGPLTSSALMPPLLPLAAYEQALISRYERLQSNLDGFRARLRHRHWVPNVRVQGSASAWDRLAVDTTSDTIDLRRQGYSVSAAVEFRFSEIVLDDQELALERERLQTQRWRDELMLQLHQRYFDARAMLLGVGSINTERDYLRIEEAVRAVEAAAFGASREP